METSIKILLLCVFMIGCRPTNDIRPAFYVNQNEIFALVGQEYINSSNMTCTIWRNGLNQYLYACGTGYFGDLNIVRFSTEGPISLKEKFK